MSIEDVASVRDSDIYTHETAVHYVTFVRHGHYDPTNKNGVDGTGLTELGIDEARSLYHKLYTPPERTVAYTMDNLRSLGTLALALYPGLQSSEVAQRVQSMFESSKLSILRGLDYLPITDDALEQKLTDVYNAGCNLAFLVNESDEYELQSGVAFSTFSRMTAEVTTFLVGESSQQGGRHRTGMILCGREFVYPCFRAAITRQVSGSEAMHAFVDWYQDRVELNESARTDTAQVLIHSGGNNFELEDAFGTLSFGRQELASMHESLVDKYGPIRARL